MFSPQEFLSGIANLVMFFLVIAAVWKLFQMGTDLHEIRNALEQIKRNTQEFQPPVPVAAEARADATLTPEELVRRVHAQDFSDDTPVLDPTVLPPSR